MTKCERCHEAFDAPKSVKSTIYTLLCESCLTEWVKFYDKYSWSYAMNNQMSYMFKDWLSKTQIQWDRLC